jgi:hypothetical protein
MFSCLIQSWMPCCDGTRPVRNVARLGEQTGVAANACVSRTPSDASLSSVGVRASGLPQQPSDHAP